MTGRSTPTPEVGAAVSERQFARPRLNLTVWAVSSVLVVAACAAISGPTLAPFSQSEIVSTESFSFPATASFLGTDYLGRDLFSRLLNGAQLTLGLALTTSILAFTLGVSTGFIAAASGGWVDQMLSRIVDALLAIPSIILALLIVSSVGTTMFVLVLTVAVIEAKRSFRLSRAVGLDISVMDFVDVARARGEGLLWIVRREILPNAWAPLAAEFGLCFTYIILFISSLSFLGLGIQPPNADWGVMVKENIQGLLYGSPAALLPAACIAAVSVSVNLLVDNLLQRSNAKSSVDMPL